MTVWCMHVTCWITKATHTHARARAHARTHARTQYVILIVFALQQWLEDRAYMCFHTYITCLVTWCLQASEWKCMGPVIQSQVM